MMAARTNWGMLFAALFVLCAGCDQINRGVVQPAVQDATDAVTSQNLTAVGMAYHSYHDVNSQGPPGWDELIAFADGQSGVDADAIRKVRDAGYTMQWNVKFSQVTGGLSNTVLAENPSGGPKLMLDGSVQ